MKMTIKEIIDGLQFTIDMFLFNPSTGEIQPKHLLNEDSRLTVDACEGAIEIIHKYQKIQKILNSASYTENGTVYSYTYDENTRIKHIREVIKDGNNAE